MKQKAIKITHNWIALKNALTHYQRFQYILKPFILKQNIVAIHLINQKLNLLKKSIVIAVTNGKTIYEWAHLLAKRNSLIYSKWHQSITIESHPLFEVLPGEIEQWERQ